MSAGGGELALDRGWVKYRPVPHAGEYGSLGAESTRFGRWTRKSLLSGKKSSDSSDSTTGVSGGVISWSRPPVKRLGLLFMAGAAAAPEVSIFGAAARFERLD